MGLMSPAGVVVNISPVKSTIKRRRRPEDPAPVRSELAIARGGRSGGTQHQYCRYAKATSEPAAIGALGRQYVRMLSLTSESVGISRSCTLPAPQSPRGSFHR